MKDVVFKIRLLAVFISAAFADWKREIWKRQLDAPYCCPGTMRDECGCMGTTLREIYSFNDSKGGSSNGD